MQNNPNKIKQNHKKRLEGGWTWQSILANIVAILTLIVTIYPLMVNYYNEKAISNNTTIFSQLNKKDLADSNLNNLTEANDLSNQVNENFQNMEINEVLNAPHEIKAIKNKFNKNTKVLVLRNGIPFDNGKVESYFNLLKFNSSIKKIKVFNDSIRAGDKHKITQIIVREYYE